jgi:cytochrome c556
MIRPLLAVATLAIGATVVAAQQDPIEARKTLMKNSGQQAGLLNRMVRGQEPYDAAKVATAFGHFADKAQKLPAAFPENSRSGDTRALPLIWEDRARFNAAIAQFTKDVADNREKAVSSLDGLKAALPAVGRNCNSCHETFRRPRT